MSRTARAALASGRRWWPELLAGGLLVLIGCAGQKDDPLFAVFVAVTLAIGWGMCARHRVRPLHEKVDRIGAGVRELLDETRGQHEPAAQEPGPRLRVVRGGHDG